MTMLLLADPITPFDWQRILWRADAPPSFVFEVVLRCVVGYALILLAVRVMGRRGARQLSIFELSILLAFGSAAGDVLIYNDTALTHAVAVFAVVGFLYWFCNRLTEWMPRFGDWLEGVPLLLVEDGEINLQNFNQLNLSQKELFGELRRESIEHLGQVRRAYVEATGDMSVYFYPDTDPVRPGLPIWPELLKQCVGRAPEAGPHACGRCGRVRKLARGEAAQCMNCQHGQWLPASAAERVT